MLLVLQGMDTSGKGGVIEHVVGAISPSGVRVASFTKPTQEELAHDFLWRIRQQLPRPGIVGVFDRSHYEDVLVARVRNLAEPAVIRQRYGQIVEFERELTDSDTTVVKVMLHIGAGEQKKRLADRLNQPDKHWKFNPDDLDARAAWGAYREAYQLALERTSTPERPLVRGAGQPQVVRTPGRATAAAGCDARLEPDLAARAIRRRGREAAPGGQLGRCVAQRMASAAGAACA